jgi:predicted O-methyltransferase YrrM
MVYKDIRNFIFKSGLIRFFAFFIRVRLIFQFNLNNVLKSLSWLLKTEEFTNYMYEIPAINRNQMVGAISQISRLPISEVEAYFVELETDFDFANQLTEKGKKLRRRYELIFPLPYARRVVWYALVRIYKPNVVVESGTEKGLGSLILNRALEKNGFGQLYTLDIDIYSGSLFDAQDNEKINLVIGDSIESIGRISEIDFFIQDSNHSINYEILELKALEKQLSKNSIVISDNAHDSNVLFEWSKKTGRNYIFINEQSKNHWHPGDGVGISINI